MKKIYSLLTAMAFISTAMASPLSPAEALQRVSDAESVPARLKIKTDAPRPVMTGKTSAGKNAYYVFSDESSTLFVSADDIARPLLGYSDSGNFNPQNMPPQLKSWLESYAAEIEYAQSHLRLMTEEEKEEPDKAPANATAIAPMVSTIWNQLEPFNNYCPMLGGERTVTGCVATSMAQVMKYFEWPQTEVASISYEWNNQTLTSDPTTLDWANMIDSYNGHYTTAQANAVARLMQLAGYAVNMRYDIASNGGSGAVSRNIRGALVDKFGYDVATNYVRRDYYEEDAWEQLIYDNLANIGPVIYNGRGSAGGHSFVCDGYDGNGRFHINWGWGGSEDGYYALSALNPGQLGTGGGAGGFNYDQGAVLGIRKPQEGSVAPQPVLACDTYVEGTTSGRELTVTAGEDGIFFNNGVLPVMFTVGVRLLDNESGQSYECGAGQGELPIGYGWSSYTVDIESSLPYGVYEVRPIYSVDDSEWKYVEFIQGAVDRFNLIVNEEGIAVEGGSVSGEITIKSVYSNPGFTVGEEYQVTAVLSSTYGVDVDYTMDAYLCTEEDNKLRIKAQLGNKTVTVPAKSDVDMIFSGTLSSTITPGTYILAFAQDGKYLKGYNVEVSGNSQGDDDDQGEIRPISWYGSTVLTIGDTFEGELVVTSTYTNAREYTLEAYLCVRDENGLQLIQEFGPSTVTVPGGSEAHMPFSGTISETLGPGNYVLAFGYDYNVIASIQIELISPITCQEFLLEPEMLETGKDSKVVVTISNNSSEYKDEEFSLYLCTLNENNVFDDKHYYGTSGVSLEPKSEKELAFSTVIPKDLEGDTYYLVLSDSESHVVDARRVEVAISSSIDLISAGEGDYRYFDLQGVEVDAKHLAPGLYIRYDSTRSSKILVK